MKEMAEGMYALEGEEMPCLAADLRKKIRPYIAPNTLGKAELEETAVRVICYSAFHGEWIGISWKKMLKDLRLEAEANLAAMNARLHNATEAVELYKKTAMYYLFCVLTFGIYALLGRRPQARFVEVPVIDSPISCVPLYGPGCIFDAIQSLHQQGLLRIERKDDLQVIFPTAQLVKIIM